jgi:hypothetical protein
MAAYYKVDVSLNTNAVEVGLPSPQTVNVTIPLVGPAGPQGPAGDAGAGAVESVNGQTGVVNLDAADVSAANISHDHQPGEVYADAAFVTQSGSNTARSGIYLRNGSDNNRPRYESPTTGDYIWWDSNLDIWYLSNRAGLNLYYLEENGDEFPWETDAVWQPIPNQNGGLEVDQATLFDVSDYSSASVVGLKTAKSGNATSNELVLGSDTRLTNSRTPTAHASTHHTGGSDAIAPNNIGAESLFTASGFTVSGTTTTLSAGRAQIVTIVALSATTINLPTTGNQYGDRLVIRGGNPVLGTITLSAALVSDTITAQGQQRSYVWQISGTGDRWVLNSVDIHTHAASDVTSGVFDNARINFAAPSSIGNTTPAAGSFTTLTANNTLNITTLGSSLGELAATLIHGSGAQGSTVGVRFLPRGAANASAWADIEGVGIAGPSAYGLLRTMNATRGAWGFGIGLTTRETLGFSAGSPFSEDLILVREAADTLAQRRGLSPQTFRIYGQLTGTDVSATGNYERGFMRWSAAGGVFQIGTEKGSGGGTARALEFQTDGVKRLEIVSGGRVQIPHGSVTLPLAAEANAGVLIKSNRSMGWPQLALQTDSNTAGDAAELGFGVITIDSLSSYSKIRCILGSAFNIHDFAFVLCGVEKFRIRQNDLITFGGTTSSFPALKRSSATLQVRLADDSAFGALSCGALTLNGNLDASTRDIVTDTTTGTKIGTATTQKIGFFNATPVDQPATVADPSGVTTDEDVEARTAINAIIDRLQELGLIA